MSAIGIIGFGALGRQILALLTASRRPERLALFDDQLRAQEAADSHPFAAFLEPQFADHDFYVALGYHHLERKAAVLEQLAAAGRRTPAFVHPSCHVAPSSHIAPGCVVYPGCNLDQNVALDPGVLLHNSVVVSHDSRLETAAYLAPGVVLSGFTHIGRAAFLGTGTVVADRRRIGARARVGIGSVITRDVPDDSSAIGNPQREVTHPLNLG